jgi:hypothetical protein
MSEQEDFGFQRSSRPEQPTKAHRASGRYPSSSALKRCSFLCVLHKKRRRLGLIPDEQVREWLTRLHAAADDCCQVKSIAYDIQRRSRPGPLHLAATECRIAAVQATTDRARQHHVEAARTAIAVLRRTLEDLISRAAA